MHQGVSVVIVIPVMIAIILISRNVTSKAVLWTTLVCIAAVTLFFAATSAASGDNGPILAVAGLVVAGALTYLVRRKRNR